mmetsp:Transcript_10452/g.22130  ORF Transcript_10452/g.22130 Transcript_10452/m.22130 type:complete len:202 (-) Transcript_10452:76-681(-)
MALSRIAATARIGAIIPSRLSSSSSARRGIIHWQSSSSQRPFSLWINNASNFRYNGNTSISVSSSLSSQRSAHSRPKFAWEEKTLEAFTPEDLEKRIQRIKNLTNEAQQCINDCRESISTSDFEEELHSASSAVERAELAYSELLEELASRECVDALNEVRKMHAKEEIWSQLRDGIFELRKLLLDDNRGGVDTVNDDVAV